MATTVTSGRAAAMRRCAVEEAGHAHQRVLRRRVAVAGREPGRPLGVRAVVRAAGGDAQQVDLQQVEQRPAGRRTPRAPTTSGSPTPSGPGRCGGTSKVLRRTPTRMPSARTRSTMVRITSPSAVTSPEPAKQLVEQVAVAGLHVDEVEPGVAGQPGRRHVVVGDGVELVGGEHRPRCGGRRAADRPRPGRGLHGPTPAVGELEAGDLARVEQRVELGQVVGRRRTEAELVRVGPSLRAHGEGLPTPHQARPARAEPGPTTSHEIGGAAVVGAVPALHGQDGEAVGAGAPGDRPLALDRASRSGGSTNGNRMPRSSRWARKASDRFSVFTWGWSRLTPRPPGRPRSRAAPRPPTPGAGGRRPAWRRCSPTRGGGRTSAASWR